MPKNSAIDDELAAAVQQLVEEFKPTDIYLFGSQLEGKARPESSYDVLVISSKVDSVRFLDRIKRALKVTEDVLPTLAPLVYTPAEVELLQQQGDGFMAEVLEQGRVLYHR